MKKHIPNFLTCCNLICGCLGILNIFNIGGSIFGITDSPVMSTAYFIWAACVFDFLDGFAARALGVSSPIGKELDSLADVISFGLLPTFLMYILLGNFQNLWSIHLEYLPYLAFLIIVCSALRLAIFNIDETQKDSFRGLPTPANALFITGLPFLFAYVPYLGVSWGGYIFSPWGMIVVTIVFSLLMVSRIELFALKFKNFTWADNKVRFAFLILSIVLLATVHLAAIPLIIILYILLSLAVNALSRRTTKS